MAWNENLTALNYVLANLYPMLPGAIRIAAASGIPIVTIAFRDKAIDNWFEILSAAEQRGKVLDIIRAALKDYPEDPILIQAEKGELSDDKGPAVRNADWRTDLSNDNLEKLMGTQSTLLPISFLEIGLQRSRSVARVCLASGEVGSGFLIEKNLFVTNNHVINTKEQAKNATIEFNYQQSSSGLDLAPVSYQFDPDAGFMTSVEDDWTFIRVKDDANAQWGAIHIEQADVSKTQWVNIIQHPGGGPKQIALYNNVVVYADEKRVQYLTDTLPGSSGSPVFDSQWCLVALHHSGGWIREPGTKKQAFRNEGININLVLAGIAESGFWA